MSGRPDVRGDAETVLDAVANGGIAIIPGDLGYAIVGSTAEALHKSFVAKGRGAHKRHGMLGSWNLHKDLHVIDQKAREIVETLVFDHQLPIGIVAPFRRDHPVLRSLDDETLASCTSNGTLAMLINNGQLFGECTRLSYERSIPLLGSSANLTGTGPKFLLEDVQQPLRDVATVAFDYGLAKFHLYRRSSTMIDFTTMEVIRIGSCYDVISSVLEKRFGIELPPDPGFDALPSGHLRPEMARS
jgi:tRNA A37 threonylcarbamoyladenosine synthetase subunit TsaC/SUA5/YrdC